jgi:phosphohistidine phosphatase SixA
MRRYIAVLLVSCAPLLLAPAGASAQEVIYLIRHAEQGPPPELVLTEAGHRRAAALSHRLKDARINAVFVTNAARTQQTAAPIARALNLEPKQTPMDDVDLLVKQVRSQHAADRVLIVNHSLNVGKILKGFGHREEVVVARDDYEPLFVIVPRGEGPPLVLMLRL